jgi:hypothetical protein
MKTPLIIATLPRYPFGLAGQATLSLLPLTYRASLKKIANPLKKVDQQSSDFWAFIRFWLLSGKQIQP